MCRSNINKRLADVEPDGLDAAPSKSIRVASRPAPDIEHAMARFEAEHVDEKVNLLFGALGERVPEICRPHMVGQGFKPVVHRFPIP